MIGRRGGGGAVVSRVGNGLQRGSGVWPVSTLSSPPAMAPRCLCSPGGTLVTAAAERGGDYTRPSAVPSRNVAVSRLKEPPCERDGPSLKLNLFLSSSFFPLSSTSFLSPSPSTPPAMVTKQGDRHCGCDRLYTPPLVLVICSSTS